MDPRLARIDAFCDTIPRRLATVYDEGSLRLFVREGPGFPLYARPQPGAGPVTAADVLRTRERQHALRAAEAFEWVAEVTPSAEAAMREAGLEVQLCPILVLDGPPAPATLPDDAEVRLLDADDTDLAVSLTGVSEVGAAAFGVPVPPPPDLAAVAAAVADLQSGHSIRLLVAGPTGPVAAGQVQRAGGVAELVGIGTVERFRGRGLGAAVTALLASAALEAGDDLVFLAAGDDTATRVYERVGFRRIGTAGIAG